MGFDGSGTYTRTNGTLSGSNLWQQRATQANPVISATEHDGEMNDVATALTACIKANGSKAASGNQPMAGFKHTGVGDATANDQYVTYGQVTSTGVPDVYVYEAGTASTDTATVRLRCGGVGASIGGLYAHNSASATYGGEALELNTSAPRLIFGTGGFEKARIDASGNLGIGTTSPGEQIHIKSASPRIRLEDTDAGASTIYSQISGNSQFGSITIQADTGNAAAGSSIRFEVDSTAKAVITSNGNLLVGTETDDAAPTVTQGYFYRASGNHQLKVATDQIANTEYAMVTAQAKVGGATRTAQLFVYKHSGINDPCGAVRIQRETGDFDHLWHDQTGNLRTSTSQSNIGTAGGTVVGTQTSDERLKEEITPLSYGLAELKQLQPKSFCFTVAPEVAQIGFIAQQVQPIIPEAVYDTKEVIPGEVEAETKLAMDYSKLIPVLVNAVKELSAKVEALEAELIALKGA